MSVYINDKKTLVPVAGGGDINAAMGHGYGTCSTAESATAKVATLADYELMKDGAVAIKFTNAVPASSTLNINSKGAKPIYYKGSAILNGIIRAGDTATFFYDGNYYHVTSVDRQMDFSFDTHALMNSAISGGSVPNGAICHAGFTDYKVVNGVAEPIIKHNENLLDNAYFVGGGSQQGGGQFPINQRGGWVVPENVGLYVVGGTAYADKVTDKYYAVTPANDDQNVWFSVVIDGATYWAHKSNCVPGYTGSNHGYGIDRWINGYAETTALIGDDALTVKSGLVWLFQRIENVNKLVGEVVTISAIIDGNLYKRTGTVPSASGSYIQTVITDDLYLGFGIDVGFRIVSYSNVSKDHLIQAAKLELGTEQTLAHQDAQGNWVLNDPPPNFQQELAKCQRYYYVSSSDTGLNVNSADVGVCGNARYIPCGIKFPVTMRVIPNIRITYLAAYDDSGNNMISNQENQINPDGITREGFSFISSNDKFVSNKSYYIKYIADANL